MSATPTQPRPEVRLGLLTRPSCAAVPDTTVRELRPDIDQFVIVASDGLWDVFQDREAVEFAAAAMAEAADPEGKEGKEGKGAAELERAATALVKAALEALRTAATTAANKAPHRLEPKFPASQVEGKNPPGT